MKEEFNLSEKILTDLDEHGFEYLELSHVKEFIRLLKDDYDKRLDKIQKSFKATDNPEIAMARFNVMGVTCGFIDYLEQIAGEKLK